MSQAGKRGPSPAKAGGAHGRSQGAASFFNLFSFNTPHAPASSTFRIAYSTQSPAFHGFSLSASQAYGPPFEACFQTAFVSRKK